MFSGFEYITTHDMLTLRCGIRTCAGNRSRGTVILLNGRAEFLEKYNETVMELDERGFDVYSFDWRGQGLSSRSLNNRYKGFVKTYDDYLLDLKRFFSTVVEPRARKPFLMLSHSLGGHIALRFLKSNPGAVDSQVLISPMIDIHTSPWPGWFAKALTRLAIRTGFGENYAVGHSNGFLIDDSFKGNKLTSDPDRFQDQRREIAANPDLGLGGVTYQWLDATFDSIDILKQPGFMDTITTPTLAVCAEHDRVTRTKVLRAAASRMPDCRLVEIKGAKHEILKEVDTVQSIFWQEFDTFTASLG